MIFLKRTSPKVKKPLSPEDHIEILKGENDNLQKQNKSLNEKVDMLQSIADEYVFSKEEIESIKASALEVKEINKKLTDRLDMLQSIADEYVFSKGGVTNGDQKV